MSVKKYAKYFLIVFAFSQCKEEAEILKAQGKLTTLQSYLNTTISYNDDGTIAEVSMEGYRRYELSYFEGNLVKMKFYAGNELRQDMDFIYDNGELVKSITNPVLSNPVMTISTYAYNTANQIVSQKDSISGNPIETEPWSVSLSSNEYDAEGNLIKAEIKDSIGNTIDSFSYTYDNSKNPLFNNYFTLTGSARLEFKLITGKNNLTGIESINDSQTLISYEYDDANFPVRAFVRKNFQIVRFEFIYE